MAQTQTTPRLTISIRRRLIAAVILAALVTLVTQFNCRMYGSRAGTNWGIVVSTMPFAVCHDVGFELKGDIGPFTDNC